MRVCNLAPVVYYSEKITSLYNVIVMEYIENATSLREYVKSSSTVDVQSVKTKCTKILNELHEAGYCHGDFRSNNILVRSNLTIVIIDFDWAGKDGDAKYPLFMNHVDIMWPDGAKPGERLVCRRNS